MYTVQVCKYCGVYFLSCVWKTVEISLWFLWVMPQLTTGFCTCFLMYHTGLELLTGK